MNTVYASAFVGPPIYLKVDAPQVLTVNAVSSSVTLNGTINNMAFNRSFTMTTGL